MGERAAAAAVLLGDRQAQQADVARLAPQLAVDLLGLRPALVVGRELLLAERVRELAEGVEIRRPSHEERWVSGMRAPKTIRMACKVC